MSPTRIASYCALALAPLYLVFAITFLLLPARIGDVPAVLLALGSNPRWYSVFYAEWILIGLLGIAIVSQASRLFVPATTGWSEWASRLAYLGFAVSVVQGVRAIALLPSIGQLYLGCGTCTASLADQQTLAKWLYISLPLDPFNWLTFGAVGLWIIALSIHAIRGANMPRAASWEGLAAGLSLLLVVVVGTLDQPLVIPAALSAVLAAAWFGWIGVRMRAEVA